MSCSLRSPQMSDRPVSRIVPVLGAALLVLAVLLLPGAASAGDETIHRITLTFDHGEAGLYTVVVAAGRPVEAALADGSRLRVVPRLGEIGRVELEVTPIVIEDGTARAALERTRFLAGQVGFPEHLAGHDVALWIDGVDTVEPHLGSRREADGPAAAVLGFGVGGGDPVAPASDCQCCVTCDAITYCAWAVRTPCGSCQCKDGIAY